MSNYIVITPVKDEERYIEQTLASMVAQTLPPVVWIVVDDGSTDRTPEMVECFAREHKFIRPLRREKRGARQTGVAEVHAFNAGFEVARHYDYDFVVKLDGDLSFGPSYFADLLAQFKRNPRLGIASGVYLEHQAGDWKPIFLPGYHAAGASKVVRKECFAAIGGFIAERGWDTVDEIRAWVRGWETMHFPELQMKHLKAEGSGMGQLYTAIMQGEIFYRTGGGPLFFVSKVSMRLFGRPFVSAGLFMFWGFVRAMFSQRELLVTAEEGRVYRKLLWHRLVAKFKRAA